MTFNITESIRIFADYLIDDNRINIIAGVATINLSEIELDFNPAIMIPYLFSKLKCQEIILVTESPTPGNRRHFSRANYKK